MICIALGKGLYSKYPILSPKMTFEQENSQVIQELLQHLKLGKPIGTHKRKPIKLATEKKYTVSLQKLSKWLGKPFRELAAVDIDTFRMMLRDDKIRDDEGKPYEVSSKRDIEVKTLRTMLQFVGKPELALFSTDYTEQKEVPALTRKEVENIVSQCKMRDKVIFQILFDSGCRADEFLSLRFCDVYDDILKKEGYYKLRIIKSKTIPRTVGLTLPLSTDVLDAWLENNKDKVGTSKPLIDLSYQHFHLIISRIALKVLKKKITPHTLRHSSATYYCHSLSRYQLCKRFGWTMSSDMPARYIDREGVEDDVINKKMVTEENASLQKQINSLQEQLNSKNEQLASFQKNLDSEIDDLRNTIGKMYQQEMKRKLKKMLVHN